MFKNVLLLYTNKKMKETISFAIAKKKKRINLTREVKNLTENYKTLKENEVDTEMKRHSIFMSWENQHSLNGYTTYMYMQI